MTLALLCVVCVRACRRVTAEVTAALQAAQEATIRTITHSHDDRLHRLHAQFDQLRMSTAQLEAGVTVCSDALICACLRVCMCQCVFARSW